MAPKKSIAKQLRARLSPVRGDPEEGGDDDQDELDPPLNQQGAEDFDRIVGPPSGKGKRAASGSASAASTRVYYRFPGRFYSTAKRAAGAAQAVVFARQFVIE